MSVYIHPMVSFLSESPSDDTQMALYSSDPAVAKATRYLESKPALLVITDASNTILLSLIGTTGWSTDPMDNDSTKLQHLYYRNSHGGDISSTAKHQRLDQLRPQCPLVPALRFTPLSQFTSEIINTGTAAKAFLLVDVSATRSPTDISQWEAGLREGTTPLDTAALPSGLQFMQLGLGTIESDEPVRLTNDAIDVNQSVVQLADGYIQLYFTNMFHNWTGMREALDARLAAITGVGTTLQDIADKEAALTP